MVQDVISYKCLVRKDIEDGCWELEFPDLNETFYDDLDYDPIKSAKSQLSLYLLDMEDRGINFPYPSTIKDEEKEKAEKVKYIVVDLEWARLITISYNKDGSLSDPRQQELLDYYLFCEGLDVEPNQDEIREIVYRTLL